MDVQAIRVKRPALDVLHATRVALDNGAVVLPPGPGGEPGRHVAWDIKGRCERPVTIDQEGYGHLVGDGRDIVRRPAFDTKRDKHGEWKGAVWQSARTLSLMVPCRQCTACLRYRANLWGKRVVAEAKASSRTWFGTLTFRPEERFRLLSMTRQRVEEGGEDPEPCDDDDYSAWHEERLAVTRGPAREDRHIRLDDLPPIDRFREAAKETGATVTKYLKRLRFGAKAQGFEPLRFRYFCAVEPHRDFSPHYHLVMHELTDEVPLRKRALERAWDHGFIQWRLIKDGKPQDSSHFADYKAAFYAAKYLSKYSMARVRASTYYGKGQTSSDTATNRMRANKHRPPKNKQERF